eukprot:jgi/Mesen1/9632/ME000669S09071
MDEPSDRLLEVAQLSESGRPVPLPNEVECQLIDATSIEFETTTGEVMEYATLRGGLLFLTTHRLIWIDEFAQFKAGEKRRAHALPLPAVVNSAPARKSLSKMFASPRQRLTVRVNSERKLVTSSQSGASQAGQVAASLSATSAAPASTASMNIIFRGQESHLPFIAQLQEVLQARAWEADAPSPSATSAGAAQGGGVPASRFNPAMAGVSGILRRQQEQLEATDKTLQEAFSDLNALMAKAKDLVPIAERIRAKLVAPPAGSSGGGGGGAAGGAAGGGEEEPAGPGGSSQEQQEMQDYLLRVGIVSPVTKGSAGALYHQQLSRQLADFLREPLERAGGMLATVDLISPDDLLLACAAWSAIDIPMRLRRFESGVAVIQSMARTDDEMTAQLQQLAATPEARRQGISARDAAQALGVAPALAKEELLAAESRGYLCRDDAVEGLRFYHNFFNDADVLIQ